MKAHTYYIIFGRPPIGEEASLLSPWRRHWCVACIISPLQSQIAVDPLLQFSSLEFGNSKFAPSYSRVPEILPENLVG